MHILHFGAYCLPSKNLEQFALQPIMNAVLDSSLTYVRYNQLFPFSLPKWKKLSHSPLNFCFCDFYRNCASLHVSTGYLYFFFLNQLSMAFDQFSRVFKSPFWMKVVDSLLLFLVCHLKLYNIYLFIFHRRFKFLCSQTC